MVCGLEIPLAILGAVAGIMTAVASLSESLALQKKYSANGILHGIYHILHPEKCIEPSDSSDSIISLDQD
tara:strand:+ start:1328 stop:1537 length:210 start_codon:yes stop_codon:yes gene_type:complete